VALREAGEAVSRDDFGVLAEALELRGRDVVDVGCGNGALVRRLAAAGARALGVEVSEDAVARARDADPEHPERYLLGGADALPLEDASVDVAVLMRSLHHVPRERMDTAMRELRRVVRGELYVAEPLAEGDFFELMRPVDDETEVRALAQAALERASGFFERVDTLHYSGTIRLDRFEAFRDMVIAADPERATRFATLEPDLRTGFTPGDYTAPMRVDILRPR
jgi:SAM-dependent methyltransferase